MVRALLRNWDGPSAVVANRKITVFKKSLTALAFAGLAAPGVGLAQVVAWDFTDRAGAGSCAPSSGGWTANANVVDCQTSPSGSTPTLQARSYSSTGTGGAMETASVRDETTLGFGSFNRIEINNNPTGLGQRGFDNLNNNGTDMLLLDFEGVARVLRSVVLGRVGGDADFQVLRWTGDTDASISTVAGSIVGRTAASMLVGQPGGQWALAASVDAGPAQSYGLNLVNPLSESSSYWLISAYNSGFGGAALTAADDTFMLAGVTTGTEGVPAPSTLALAGLALLGAACLRRRAA